jgi:hypothetical protein
MNCRISCYILMSNLVLVAVMLLYLSEEDTFWTLSILIEDILPKDFYSKVTPV